PRLAPRDAVELTQLLERVDAHVRVRADAESDSAVEEPLDREEAVAEVRLGRRADADARAGGREQVELVSVGVRCMHDGRARAETAADVEQLDRAQPVLGKALLDLARLLVGVHVQRQLVLCRVAPELLEPVPGTCPDRVGRDPDADSVAPQLLELVQVGRHRLLPEALDPTPGVRDVEQYELDPGLRSGLGRRTSLLEPEVVELSDRGVAGAAQLAVDGGVVAPHPLRRLTLRQREHRVAPRPEVAAFDASAQRSLERVAVRVHEAGDPRQLSHARILSTWRPVPSPCRSRSSRTRSRLRGWG